MQEAQPVLLERDGPVAIVRLNRPDKHNAINGAMSAALARTMAEVDADDSIRAIVLTGSGERAFCAGADMGEMVNRLDGQAADSPAVSGYSAVLNARKPVIAAVNGFAYGGGALLMVNTDIRLAAPTATIRFIGTTYGLVVGGSELPRIVGPARAKELLYTDEIAANSADAVQWAKRVVNAATEVDEGRAVESESNRQLRASRDHDNRFREATRRVVSN
jgi:enoyl-CoA hydratase/carnithine racemase